ncbi:hypothetical protein GCM10022630_07690 [Thermobifida alba]
MVLQSRGDPGPQITGDPGDKHDAGHIDTPSTGWDGGGETLLRIAHPHHALPGRSDAHDVRGEAGLLLVTACDTGLLQQFAVLLLGHALAALLDDRTHGITSVSRNSEDRAARRGTGDRSAVRAGAAARDVRPDTG